MNYRTAMKLGLKQIYRIFEFEFYSEFIRKLLQIRNTVIIFLRKWRTIKLTVVKPVKVYQILVVPAREPFEDRLGLPYGSTFDGRKEKLSVFCAIKFCRTMVEQRRI